MKTRVHVLLALALFSAGCSTIVDPAPVTPDARPAAVSALPRAMSGGEQKVVAAVNDFSFSLFRSLSSANKDSNVFTSPLSASMALGMTMNGAANATYDQMRSALALGSATDAEINASYKSLIALLRGLDASVDFRIANSIWYSNAFPFHQTFIDANKSAFDAQIAALDFASPASVKTINDWVSTSTAGKIPTIIDKIDAAQVMFLINAIYFKANWRDKFNVAETKDSLFAGIAGLQPMKLMHRHGEVSLLARTEVPGADLPYGDSTFTMTVLLPQGQTVDALAASLTPASWASYLSQFHTVTTDIWMPRLRLTWERELNAPLMSLGMRDAFFDGADFTRLSPRGRELIIDKVKQKTFVDINEEGTEAAAATSVGISLTSAPPSLRIDRPFIFVIRERLSGTILFMGKIVRMP